jgi:alcohol dehydrogenase (cytochrome c)
VNSLWLLGCFVLLLSPGRLWAQVSYERIVRAESEPGHWLTYSGGYSAHRFSLLKQITPQKVAGLKPLWVYQTGNSNPVESSPLVVDGVLYLTQPPSSVIALDVHSGRSLWTWERPMPRDLRTLGLPVVNRGVALLNDMVFVGTLDNHLVALDAKSGAVRWDTVIAENKTGYSITAAPLAIDGKVIVGISGGDAGIRGFLDAYDARSGQQLWRFWTIPGPEEIGHETWGGESWKTGAGGTWLTGSYDPQLNLVYWGVGNPGPDFLGDVRPGDNLYTCSLLALDASTGKRKWHFQFTPHDVHDWDANQVPVLLDAVVEGRPRKVVATANRNGFYYLLDRETGEFLLGVPYAKQTWAEGLDHVGRPILTPDRSPTAEGTLIYPSLQGATNWFSPSFSPLTKLFYVSVREMGAYYFKGEGEYKPGMTFVGGGEHALAGDQAYGAVRALEVETGKMRWEFRLHSPPWAGLLATAGGLVFGGSHEGNFYALDAWTGEPRWQFQTGGPVRANPISFLIDDKQYVAIAAGQALFVFGLP